MNKHFLYIIVLLLTAIIYSCGSKAVVADTAPVETIEAPLTVVLTDDEVIKKYFNNEFENYKDAHSATYSVLFPAMEINPSSIPEELTFKFERLKPEPKRYSLYRVEAYKDTLINRVLYVELRTNDDQWKIDRIYMFDIQEVMRGIYKNQYLGKTKVDMLVDYKAKRERKMRSQSMTDTLKYNKRFGDFEAYLREASKVKLSIKSDEELIAYFKKNKIAFEKAIEGFDGQEYVAFNDKDYGYILNDLSLDTYNYENQSHYFSIIGGFGEGLEGQELGFVKAMPSRTPFARRFYTNTEPYLLLIPIEDGWYLYKQK